MGVWYKPQEWLKKFRRKKDSREICREKYGDDFVEIIPIGNLEETQNFLEMVKATEEEPTCKDCQRECQMIGLDMEACASYEPPKEETNG